MATAPAKKPAAAPAPGPRKLAAALAPGAAANQAEAPPKKKGKKLLVMAIVMLTIGAGGAAWHFMKPRPVDAAAAKKAPPKKESVFLPMENFTINLTSPAIDRYLQLGITLEVANPAIAEELKRQMPAVRSRILLLLASKTPEDLATTVGKQKLIGELLAEARAPLAGSELPGRGVDNVHFSAFVIQ